MKYGIVTGSTISFWRKEDTEVKLKFESISFRFEPFWVFASIEEREKVVGVYLYRIDILVYFTFRKMDLANFMLKIEVSLTMNFLISKIPLNLYVVNIR